MTDAQKQQALYLLVEQSTTQANNLVIAALVGLSLSLALLFLAYYLLNYQIKQRQQAEAKLRDLYDNAPCGYHSLDKDGIFIEINNIELSWLGYSREEIIGKRKFSSLLAPESLATFEKNFPRCLEQGWIKDLEFEMLRKDGTILPVLLNATAIKDTAGNFVASRSTLFDISKRKRVEEALRESDQRFQGLAEATFEGIVIHEQGKIIDANQSFANLFGYELGEVIGMEAKDFLTPESLASVMARAVNGDEKNGDEKPYEIVGLRKDRTTLPLEVIGKNCIYQGRQVRVSAARNITERKQAEERLKQAHDRLEIEVAQRTAELSKTNERLQTELRERQQVEAALQESEERFRSAFDNAAIGKALVALDGRWLKVNRSLCEIVGYCEQELLATTFQAITHPDDLNTDIDCARQLLEGKIRSYEMEKRYCHKLGHIVWILLSGSLVRDAEGKPLYFIAQIQDITLRKQAEQALRESEERYRAIVEDQTELITRFQPDGTLTFVNEAYCRYFGQEREALIGNCYEPFIFEEDREAIAQFLDSLSLENPVGTIEHRVVVAGEIRWMQWINRAIFD
ncbi:MAG TPA: PAS domain S-box protein, partial [Chroococcales cyanobacterium]